MLKANIIYAKYFETKTTINVPTSRQWRTRPLVLNPGNAGAP